ncbi:MAG: DUF4091 domain-containing protein [Oscillospiraceae bacterium]|nr:DUF4091 domain-containing protein [Oscillospiraceae bacterium]
MKKKFVSTLLCAALILTMAGPVGVITTAEAATGTYYGDASSWNTEGRCPKAEGQVFSGWYQDVSLQTTVDGPADFAPGAYAAFADENVLGVRYQVAGGTTKDSDKTSLRLVTSVDSLRYRSVGFSVEINGRVQTLTTDKVYKTIQGYTKEDGVTTYTPEESFTDTSRYFMAFTLRNIPKSVFGTPIQVTAIWTTMDGTVVSGKTRTVVLYGAMQEDLQDATGYGRLWSAPSTVKIGKAETDYANKGAPSLSFRAVRNEYESAQLLLTADKAVSSFALYPGDLTCGGKTLLAENVDVYVQKSINYNESVYSYGSGSMPDALLPMTAAQHYGENTAAAGTNGGMWVTLYVPKDTPAGVYEGSFILHVAGADGEELVTVPVSLEVLDYTLGDTPAAKTLFSWRYDRVAPGELDGSLAMMERYYEFFRDYRISLQALPLGTLSGEELVRAVEKYYDTLSTYTILSEVGDISGSLLSHTDAAKEQILALAAASTPQRNLLDKAMIYFIDEPDITDAETRNAVITWIDQLNAILDECVQTIASDQTGRYDQFKQIDGWQSWVRDIPNVIPITKADWLLSNQNGDANALLNKMNAVCLLFDAFTQSQSSRIRTMCDTFGLHLWWYGNSTPGNPAPSYHVADTNLLSSRSVSWLQSKYGVEGNLYWDAAAYTDEAAQTYNEYIDVYAGAHRNTDATWATGDGNLTYPGAPYGVCGPIPSLRLMSIRDGMEEYELLQAVEEKLNSLSFSGGTPSVADAMESLFYRPLYTGDMTSVTADGANGFAFSALRQKLLGLLVNLDRGLGYTMGPITTTSSLFSNKATFTCYVQPGATLSIDGTAVSSGTSRQVTLSKAGTSVTVTVTKDGETASYTQYLGKSNSLFGAAAGTAQPAAPAAPASAAPAAGNGTALLSFESYGEITGAGLRMSKLLGRTEINTDPRYVTGGAASWMIRPEGDYGDPNGYPWFRMRCPAFGAGDFSSYGKILMDVYNAGDEAVLLRWSFTVANGNGEYVVPDEVFCELAPNEWTVCSYDLTDAVYDTLFDLTDVKYMTVTILNKKESREEVLAPLYFDSLRAQPLEGQRHAAQNSFAAGISFDGLTDADAFAVAEDQMVRMTAVRTDYRETPMAAAAAALDLGTHCLRADATGSVWPELTVTFDRTYDQGKLLTFWLYVAADESAAAGKTYRLEAFRQRSGTEYKVLNGDCRFNRWVQISIELAEATDHLWYFINLDNGAGVSKLGAEQVSVYLDEFQIVDNTWGPLS